MRTINILPVFTASLLLSLTACPPAEPAGGPPAPTSTAVEALPPATATAVASAEPTAEPSATATAEPPPPVVGSTPDLAESPGDARLEGAAGLVKSGDHFKAKAALTKAMPDIDKTASLDAKMAAHALLGRTCAALKDEKCAAEQYKIVRELWKDPDSALKALAAFGGDEKAKMERARRALFAVGEALFAAAEEKRATVDKEKFPAYRGSGDRKDVMRHIQVKLGPWVKARRAAIEEAERAYTAVMQLQPVPPPQWVVASAARVGQMWGRFVAEFRAAPIPNEWKGSGPMPATGLTKEEVRRAYYEAIDEASAPQLAQARSAFQTCADLAKKFSVESEYSKSCNTWLEKAPAPAASP